MIKIGAIGTGSISKSMIAEFQKNEDLQCVAIYSRKEHTGRAIADQFGIPTVYTKLEDMLADPEIDLVYVASPNSIHYRQTKAALLAGKHVLCEKPFAPTVAEAEELITLAKQKHLFLFEAITTAHHPGYAMVKEHLPQAGPVKMVVCTFCQYSSRYPALLAGDASPVLDPAFCGGALMDINLYNIHFVVGLFGTPEKVHYFPNVYKTGVDTSGTLILEYPGFICQCIGAKDCAGNNGVQIIGENGRIEVAPSSSTLQEVDILGRGKEPVQGRWPENPWFHEVADIGRILAAGDYDACYKALDVTLQVVDVLEKARKSGGLCF